MLDRIVATALTFDDILLVPAYSEVLPDEADVSTRLTKDIRLNIPLISAVMDTVTEDRFAIAIAREGGVGIIHKNCSPTKQAEMVSATKRSQSGLITNPFTLAVTNTAKDARKLIETRKISGIPIKDEAGKLLGLVTRRDLRETSDDNKPVSAIMTPIEKLVTGGPQMSLEEAKRLMDVNRKEKLPLVDGHGMLAGLYTYRDILIAMEYPFAAKDNRDRLLVGAAVGATGDYQERAILLVKAGVDILCVDSSHGHSRNVLDAVAWLKTKWPTKPVMAGNVATYAGGKALVEAGVDVVKAGVGPGSICTTRVVTGAGVPQVHAISEVVRACRESGIPVIADGGIRYSGDITKALACGADTVMIGSLFAGTEEAPGETIMVEGRPYKEYHGMGSIAAMKKGSKDRYFQDKVNTDDPLDSNKLVPQGVEGQVAYSGKLEDVVHQLVGGLRFGMGLTGSRTIPDLWNAEAVQITQAGFRESHPHSIIMTKEPRNYPIPRG